MSMILREGKTSTEHARAWRCEVSGNILLVASLVLLFLKSWVLCAVYAGCGTALVLGATWAYIHGRSSAKGAVSRPPVHPGPKGV